VKVILDTNVFVSGVFFSGSPHQILKAWRDGKLELVIASDIFDEYRRVATILAEQFPPVNLQEILGFVEKEAEFFDAPTLSEQVCDDPDDDKFLACALASDTKIIVSGDKHLLRVSGYQDIEVLKPKAFVDAYLA
jgi:putative PIN family toxin of toxin-antitoxin system